MQTFLDTLRQLKRLGLILLLFLSLSALLLAAPFLWGNYARILPFTMLLYVTMALSYDVVGGILGYLYLGHGLFFGLGAYATAILLTQGQPLLLALIMAAGLTLPAATLLSLPLFRLRKAVFALATLGLLLFGGQLARNLSWLTGGSAGLSLAPNSKPIMTYSLSLALAFGMITLHRVLCNSRLGLKLRAIQESEDMAESVGIDCGMVKRLAFIVSAIPVALVGGLHAREISFVIPSEAFGLENSLAPILMCLLFKPGTTWGPLLGALVLFAAQEVIWTTLPSFHMSLYGIILIFIGIQRAKQS